MQKYVLIGLGFALSASAFAQERPQTNALESFLTEAGTSAVEIDKGVYEVQQADGTVVRHAFGTDGARYDLAQAKLQLALLHVQGASRKLSESDVDTAATLQTRILELQSVVDAKRSPNASTDTISIPSCQLAPVLYVFSPSTNNGNGVAALTDRLHYGFGPPPPNSYQWTLNASATMYSDSTKTIVLASDTATPVTVSGPAAGRATAVTTASHPCYGVSISSASNNICASPNNYASVTSSSACP